VNLVPNIGIIVGNRATLVVDAGMGPRNGQTVLRELAKVSKNADLYLTTTHFHPEHVTGAQAFPANTKIIRSEAQEEEVKQKQPEFIHNFSQRTPEIQALLQDVKPRPPDILFDREVKLDLGGVTARLFLVGPGHTRGDTAVYVEEDKVLFTGDVVVNRFFPIFPDRDASGKNWLAILNQFEALQPRTVVPGHGEVGDAGLLSKEQGYLKSLQSRVAELKESLLTTRRSCYQTSFGRNIRTGRTLGGFQMPPSTSTRNRTDFRSAGVSRADAGVSRADAGVSCADAGVSCALDCGQSCL